jgi:hypothetical protein
MVHCVWVLNYGLSDQIRNGRQPRGLTFVIYKSKSSIEANQPGARRCRGVIALGSWCKPDFRRMAIREIAKLSHNRSANALFSVRYDDPGELDGSGAI